MTGAAASTAVATGPSPASESHQIQINQHAKLNQYSTSPTPPPLHPPPHPTNPWKNEGRETQILKKKAALPRMLSLQRVEGGGWKEAGGWIGGGDCNLPSTSSPSTSSHAHLGVEVVSGVSENRRGFARSAADDAVSAPRRPHTSPHVGGGGEGGWFQRVEGGEGRRVRVSSVRNCH